MKGKVTLLIIGLLVALLISSSVYSAAKAKLTIWGWNITVDSYKAVAEEFQKTHPNVDFEYVEMSFGDTHDKLLTSLVSGIGAPDICAIEQTRVPMFVAGGGLLDLTDVGEKYKDQFATYAYDVGVLDGKLYAMPWDIGPCAIYYRSDIFEEYGATPPKTWDEFVEMGKKLSLDLDGDGKKDQYMLNIPLNDAKGYTMFLQSRAGNVFDKDGNVLLDNPLSIEVMQWYTDLALKHDIAFFQNAWEPAWFNAFKEGRMITIPIAVWFSGQIKVQAPDLAGKWRITPWPSATDKPAGTNWGGSDLVITEQTKYPQEAKDFVEFMLCTKEGQLIVYKAVNIFPALLTALEDPLFDEPDPYYGGQAIGRIFVDSVPYIPTWYYTKNWTIAETAMNTALSKILNKKATVEEAMKAAAKETRKAMER